MDVDGVLTDGGVIFTGQNQEAKRFSIADGLGIQLALSAGLIVLWITGRESEAVERRAAELGVTNLYQKSTNKAAAVAELMGANALTQANVAYIGDDLND